MGKMIHLNDLLIAVPSELYITGQIPVVGVVHNAGERQEFAISDLSREDTSKIMHSWQIGEVKLADQGFGIDILGNGATQFLCVGIGVWGVSDG